MGYTYEARKIRPVNVGACLKLGGLINVEKNTILCRAQTNSVYMTSISWTHMYTATPNSPIEK